MLKVLSWIVENYELLILVGACLLDVVLFLVGVFKKKDHCVLDQVLYCLPVFIKEAENSLGAGCGDLKLKKVLSMALEHYFNLSGVKISESSAYARVIKDQIEAILETPTKKGN